MLKSHRDRDAEWLTDIYSPPPSYHLPEQSPQLPWLESSPYQVSSDIDWVLKMNERDKQLLSQLEDPQFARGYLLARGYLPPAGNSEESSLAAAWHNAHNKIQSARDQQQQAYTKRQQEIHNDVMRDYYKSQDQRR